MAKTQWEKLKVMGEIEEGMNLGLWRHWALVEGLVLTGKRDISFTGELARMF